MQIGEVVESDNYAIIGGGKAREFKIAASSHAFRMMIDTLYSDKIMAVAREVICNAVDAHIAAGVDKPIDIRLNQKELTITDFGNGIADEDMEEVYLTVFGSTKQEDNRQTGGFGLGCKSPFCYNETFSVTSTHKGVRNIYVLHIGDEESGGIPALKLMASYPCEDHGLTVTIPLKTSSDFHSFQQKIFEVVENGGMNAKFNEAPIPINDLTAIRAAGYGIVPNPSFHTVKGEVLFGNVRYPLDRDAPSIGRKVSDLMDRIPMEYSFLLVAPPSSIVPTPAREAISFTPRTIATLDALLSRAIKEIDQAKKAALRNEGRKRIAGKQIAEIYGLHQIGRHESNQKLKVYGGAAEVAAEWARIEFNHNSREAMVALLNLKPQLKRHFLNWQRLQAHKKFGVCKIGNWSQAQYRYTLKRLHRALRQIDDAPINLSESIRFFINSADSLRRQRNPMRNDWRIAPLTKPLTVAIAYSSEQVFSELVHRGSDKFAIVDRKMTPELANRIAEALMKFGFEPTIYKQPKPKPKAPRVVKPKVEKKVETYKFAPLNLRHSEYGSRIGNFYRLPERAVEKPTAYVEIAVSKTNNYGEVIKSLRSDFVHVIEAINKHIPDVVIAGNETDTKRLADMGVPFLGDLILDRLEKGYKKLDRFYLDCIRIDEHYWDTDRAIARRKIFAASCLKHSARLAHAVADIPYKNPIERRHRYDLWRIAYHTSYCLPQNAFRDRYQKLRDETYRASKPHEIFGKFGTRSKYGFEYLSFASKLSEIDTLTPDEEERLARMIEADLRQWKKAPSSPTKVENGNADPA